MIKILSNTKQTLHLLSKGQLKDYYTEADLQTAEKLIHFITPRANAVGILNENYIQTPTDIYVIKEVNRIDADWVEVFGKLDTDALKATIITSYDSTERLISDVLVDVLTATGWTYTLHDLPTKRRTVRMEETYAHAIILEAMKLYGFEVWFDSLNKVVHVYQVMGSNRGAYVYSDLNMRKMEQQADTYDFKTRLYAYGKDGLSFASINGGKAYVENHITSTKILEAIWKDDRYTDMASLMADAQARIDILSKPRESFTIEVVELSKLNPTYTILDFQLGDSVAVIDKINNQRDTQRIVKLTDYPITPEQNIIELANSKITMVQTSDTDAIKAAVDAVSDEIVVVQTELMLAIDAATAQITGANGGNLVIRTDPEGKPYELLIMDTGDVLTATNVWRWNTGGLGYSNSGYNGAYGTAITSSGQINADFITAGTLSASLIKAGVFSDVNGINTIDMNNGNFSLAGGAITYDGSTLAVNADIDFSANNSINNKVSDAVGPLTTAITNLQTDLADTADDIRSEIATTYVTGGTLESYKTAISTELNQTKTDFTFNFNNVLTEVETVDGKVNTKFTELTDYIRFVDGKIVLGKETSEITLEIINDRISFLQLGSEVAYISNNVLYITDGRFLTSLRIGNFSYTPRTNGNLSFSKVV